MYQKNNKIFTETANTQIYNKVYFWQRGRELNMGKNIGDFNYNIFFVKKEERIGADMKLKLDKYGLVDTKCFNVCLPHCPYKDTQIKI